MSIIDRIIKTVRPGRNRRHDPVALLAAVRERQQQLLECVTHALDQVAEERAYVEAEIARVQRAVARLDADAAAANAQRRVGLARKLHEEGSNKHLLLADLAEAHEEMAVEQDRLLDLREHLTDRLAESDVLARRAAAEGTGDVRARVDRLIAETTRMVNEQARLEGEF